jgi:hypothetical protein
MRTYSVRHVIRVLKKNPWTAIIMNADGGVTDLVCSEMWPTAEFVLGLNERYPDRVAVLRPAGSYEPSQIEQIQADAREAFILRDQGLLGPGITTR